MNEKIYSEKDLDHITTLSRATRWRLRRVGRFPHPIQISDGRIGYIAEDIVRWISDKKIALANNDAQARLPKIGTQSSTGRVRK